ncbi:hypothetical protein [Streptomyces sp. NPDC059003]|uniref:hypothetical protein n=1 Tax=Streptomyces sp. NPDC059003 TaxID=3346691 RepID=UPI0036C7715B
MINSAGAIALAVLGLIAVYTGVRPPPPARKAQQTRERVEETLDATAVRHAPRTARR